MDIGIDLAWAGRATTGLAAVDDAGRLVDARAARTDEDILGWLAEWAPEGAVVAFDAPLVVTNPRGMRPCERAIGRRFGAAGASCYPANLAMRAFADGGRAARLCRHACLRVDSPHDTARRAVEVYPHAALVSLFALPRILAYKNKPGRDVRGMRSEMLRLVALVESLEDADPALHVRDRAIWASLAASVAGATTKAGLRRAEDVLDAVVCAYLARLLRIRPEAVDHVGEVATGRIAVPIGPAREVPQKITS